METGQARRSRLIEQQRHSPAQELFARARPWIMASCGLGLGGGFVLAAVLSVTQALELPLGLWWAALVQAHGHVQLFGWAGLLVVGVALHFLPRLRGTPLVYPRIVPWLLALIGGGVMLRAFSQPLLALAAPVPFLWQALLAGAGLAEGVGASGVVGLFFLTLRRGPSLAKRPALVAFLPYMLAGLFCFWLALALNAVEGIRLFLEGPVMLSGQMDLTIMQAGLFGFLVPMALGMAARVLPLYLGLRPLPARVLWTVFASYIVGLVLSLLALWAGASAMRVGYLQGVAALLMGSALLAFISLQGMLLRCRTRLMVPAVQKNQVSLPAQPYPVARGNERSSFGSFAWLIRIAFGWLALAALALCADGAAQLAGGFVLIGADAIRHATTVGFVMLLIFGIGQRMLPGFAGSRLFSPHLVMATLWLGSAAALLRVLPVLVSPWIGALGLPDWIPLLLRGAFGLSGPLALAALLCFTINLWRPLRGGPRAAPHSSRRERTNVDQS